MTRWTGRLGAGPGYVYRSMLLVLFVTLGIWSYSWGAFRLLRCRRCAAVSLSSLAFFAEIGLGFLLLEVVLVQRFVLSSAFPPMRFRWSCSRC